MTELKNSVVEETGLTLLLFDELNGVHAASLNRRYDQSFVMRVVKEGQHCDRDTANNESDQYPHQWFQRIIFVRLTRYGGIRADSRVGSEIDAIIKQNNR